MTDSAAISALKKIGGSAGCLTDPARKASFLHDMRGAVSGSASAVLRPASTEQLSRMIKVCAEHNVSMVPHGGNTGTMGGNIPDDSGEQVVISLGRMNRIRDMDIQNFTMTVEAGCILQAVQAAAEQADLLFPLSLAAQGSCQIGGNLSTNAGGSNVLRYGSARDLVLGIEAVLPDGRIWNGLRGLRKDNTGYDLKQLFLGAEGTLGVVTAAVLKLFPQPQHKSVAIAAVRDPAAGVELLGHLRACTGDLVSGLEYMHGSVVEMAQQHVANVRSPLSGYEHLVLLEVSGGSPETDLEAGTEQALSSAFDEKLLEDAVVASNVAQQRQFWHLRESLPEAQMRQGSRIIFDVSTPVSAMPEFLEQGAQRVHGVHESVRVSPFGHLGDGNIHFNLLQPADLSREAFLALTPQFTEQVNNLIDELHGSFSAEHGIGRLKCGTLVRYRDKIELDIMRSLKSALDPSNLMNPGVILEPAPA